MHMKGVYVGGGLYRRELKKRMYNGPARNDKAMFGDKHTAPTLRPPAKALSNIPANMGETQLSQD